MGIELRCDACDFGQTLADEASAYERARVHETDHPSHNVMLRTAPGDEDPGKFGENRMG